MAKKRTVCDIDLLEKLVAEQKTDKEIAELMGVRERLIRAWIDRHGLTGRRWKNRKQEQKGPNADRHLCRKCRYRHEGGRGCDYILITGKERGCLAEECNMYEKA